MQHQGGLSVLQPMTDTFAVGSVCVFPISLPLPRFYTVIECSMSRRVRVRRLHWLSRLLAPPALSSAPTFR
jgi:hypothetical protein